MEAKETSNFLSQSVEYEISFEISKLLFCGGLKKDENDNNESAENEDKMGKNSENDEKDPLIYFIVTWSGHVFKFQRTLSEMQSPVTFVTNLHTTPQQCYAKLRNSPVMVKLCRNSSDLGSAEVLISKCFCDSILCEEFSAQSLDQDLKFRLDEETVSARGSLTFDIWKILDNLSSDKSDSDLAIDDDVAKKFAAKCNTFCENFKVTRNLTKDCRKMLEEFYNLNF